MTLPTFSSLRILVIGDVMIDRYLHGKVERISPEAPVPVVRLGEEENRLGGAANVALNLRALEAEAGLATVIGTDAAGDLFLDLCTSAGVSTAAIHRSDERQTTQKTRVLSHNQQLLRADREDTHLLPKEVADTLVNQVKQLISGRAVDLILFQDYNKGILLPELIQQIIELATAHQIPTVVDPKKDHFWSYRGCRLFKPNLREIQQQLDFPIQPVKEDLDRAAAHIFDQLGCEHVMITLSEHGIYLHDGQQSAIYPTDARDIADVSGAGDTVIAVVACALASEMQLPQIARLANLAGSQVIAKPGVVPVDLAVLKEQCASL